MTTEAIDFDRVQGNILLPYASHQANCGRLLFFRFDPEKLSETRAWMSGLCNLVTYHSDVRDDKGRARTPAIEACFNVGLTCTGLQALGYDPFTVKYLPEEFVEGMRARAVDLGDPVPEPGKEEPVHAVVMVYTFDEAVKEKAGRLAEDVFAWRRLERKRIEDVESAVAEALEGPLAKLCLGETEGVHHLWELDQDTYRLPVGEDEDLEYFGFRDGISQPRIDGVPGNAPYQTGSLHTNPPDTVLVMHHDQPRELTRTELAQQRIEHGSFLVVRKLAQDVEAFRDEMADQAKDLAGLTGQLLAEQMVGRRQDGTPLGVPEGSVPEDLDDFDYADDAEGTRCPFHSHVRRTNPRDKRSPLRRIMRRAMPYSSFKKGDRDKGLLFLAYAGDLETQFEFMQRMWINSGIESFGMSRDRDPIVAGPVATEDPDHGRGGFLFTHRDDEGSESPRIVKPLKSFVELRTDVGGYFLVPSKDTLEELSREPTSAIEEYERRVEGECVERAQDILGRWLDDLDVGKRVWKEVRERGGVVRLDGPRAVLVGSRKKVKKVLRDDGSRYSVRYQGERMKEMTGAFYLGLDGNTAQYQRESRASAAVVPAWEKNEEETARDLATVEGATRMLCLSFLASSLVAARAQHKEDTPPLRGEVDVAKFTAFVLSGLSPVFFGVPQPSGAGTFHLNTPVSGKIFFPFPEEQWLEYADEASRGLAAYLSRVFEERDGSKPVGSWERKLEEVLSGIEKAVGEGRNQPAWTSDDNVRTLSGIISGMLIASFKLFVDGFSHHAQQSEIDEPVGVPDDEKLRRRLPFDDLKSREASMPNVLYRRSMKKQKLGGVKVEKDDFVLVCQGSAMADAAERGKDQDWFYGDRAPKNGKAKTAPHFCPGYKMADSMLETMSSFLLERTDLRRADETGTLLSYAWVPENKKMDYVKALIAQKKRADQK